MKRSTKMAPVALSTSYFTGSAFIGISMITLKASGTLFPGVTLSRDMVVFRLMKLEVARDLSINPDFTDAPLAPP